MLYADKPGRASLALDLMEELRPVLADRLALNRIRVQLAGPFLWAWQDGCGGLDVTFTGAYARVSR